MGAEHQAQAARPPARNISIFSLAETRIVVVAVESANSPGVMTVSCRAETMGYSELAAQEWVSYILRW